MLTISINGSMRKMNIGCRTFITLEELFRFINVERPGILSVKLNDADTPLKDLAVATVKDGDSVQFQKKRLKPL